MTWRLTLWLTVAAVGAAVGCNSRPTPMIVRHPARGAPGQATGSAQVTLDRIVEHGRVAVDGMWVADVPWRTDIVVIHGLAPGPHAVYVVTLGGHVMGARVEVTPRAVARARAFTDPYAYPAPWHAGRAPSWSR